MDFRIIELEETLVYGVSKQYAGKGYKTREELRHPMWTEKLEDVPGQICGGKWNEPGSTVYDGIWFGIWHKGRYMIARQEKNVANHTLETYVIPAGTYAAFTTARGTLAWEEFPRLFELIFDAWLPSSTYRQKEDLAIEVLHLWTDHNLRKENRYFEVWIPVERK